MRAIGPGSAQQRCTLQRVREYALNPPRLSHDQCQAPGYLRPGRGTFQMESIRPDNTDPIPMRPAPNQFGTIMLRFVGLLAVAIAVLAIVYSR